MCVDRRWLHARRSTLLWKLRGDLGHQSRRSTPPRLLKGDPCFTPSAHSRSCSPWCSTSTPTTAHLRFGHSFREISRTSNARVKAKRLLRLRGRLTPGMLETTRARLGLVSSASAPFLIATQGRVQRQQYQAERSKRSRDKENAVRATCLASLPHASEKNNKAKRQKQSAESFRRRRCWAPGGAA